MPSENRGAAITLQNLGKRYGDVVALKNVSLNLPAGEFVTLLGPSGSGKTTTLNSIAGFLQPDEGRIFVNDQAIESVPPYKRNIGMVFQSYALFPHMTVWDNVAYPLKRRKVKKADVKSKVGEALELVGLEQLGNRYPRELSGGQQQRVALARALVFEPSILLMDEPLGALDRRLRATLQLEFKRIHRELGITFVYVTHDQDEALVMSDRIAVFNNGSIEQVGTAEDLYERPETVFVAEFLGDSNVFPGVVTRTAAGSRLIGDTYELAVPNDNRCSEGTSSVLVTRPERMRVTPISGDGPSGNVLEGRVAQAIYMGGVIRIEVELRAGFNVIAQELAGRDSKFAVGDDVLVSWTPDEAVMLPDSGTSVAGAVTGAHAEDS